ncbi:hypothetical protein LIS90_13475 [Flavobacterium psychrophilum]|uniref:hypothetical protein n=1 Tax=Flavobacterium psychrophilum TaxID=96345 RepID=UPI001D071EAC|nr:hypothetical protein [Flavobacterium psychrophilum]MCB6232257.1 hypothetical protein [Flavobacterium psychrophilum]
MEENLITKISIENLIIEAKKFEIENKSDLISYPEFIQYFKSISEINKHNLIIGINFTYGWMPTIFDFRTTEIEKNINLAVEILNKAKSGKDLETEDYELLKSLLNNSLVGSTKLLHFINPEKYAIWDSRVFRFLHNQEPHDYRIGDIQNYIDYQKLLQNLTKEERFLEFYQLMSSKLEYKPTNFRALELIMFIKGKK